MDLNGNSAGRKLGMSSSAMDESKLLTQASRKGKDPWPFNERVDVEDSS